MVEAKTKSAFVLSAEVMRAFVKEAISLAQLKAMGQMAGGGVARLGPGGRSVATQAAKPVQRSVAKTTLRGQPVPGLGKLQADYAATQQAGQELAGGKSLLGTPLAFLKG